MVRNSSSRKRTASESVDRARAQPRLTIGCVPNHSSAVDATMADSADELDSSERNTGDGDQPTISRIPTQSATSSMSQNPITKAKSDIWEHIQRSERDENGRIVLSCKYCKKKWGYSEDEYRKNGSSTGNQRRHLNSMHKKVMQGNSCVGPMDAFISKASDIEKRLAADPTISDRLIRECIEDFVLSETEPFTIIESQPFLTLLKLCLKCKRDNVFLPKADALRNGVVQRTENMKTDLKETLAREETAVHLCLDMWTSANQFSFLAVTAHYVDSNWKLTEKLLSFCETTDHTGSGMARLVKTTLEEFGLTARLGCLTMDNASSNDSLISSLFENLQDSSSERENFLTGWNPDDARIRCLPHIINLAVKAFLTSLGDDGEAQNFENDVSVIKRLRYIVKKLRNSPAQRQKYLGQCELANDDRLMLILDVPTRWNSTFYMIQRALKVRNGLKNWISTDPEIGKVKLGSCQFSQTDWEVLERISVLLEKFESASQLLSGGSYPTLSFVMPVFIELFSYIENEVANCSSDYRMKQALSAAHCVLAKYYSFTDDSVFYLLTVLLDPRFKKIYLIRKGFETDYPGLLDQAVARLKALLDKKMECLDSDGSEIIRSNNSAQDQSALFHSIFSHCMTEDDELNEVEKYFDLRCEDPAVNPLDYWKAHAQQFPNLSAVAKDVLSIPGSSVAVERIFNVGRDVIGLRRHSLKPETFSALMFGKYYLKK